MEVVVGQEHRFSREDGAGGNGSDRGQDHHGGLGLHRSSSEQPEEDGPERARPERCQRGDTGDA